MSGFAVMVVIDEIVSRMFKKSIEDTSTNSTQVKVATYGMCIHSAAEGLSLGASLFVSFFGQGSLGLIVVMAILMHKAPESIGYGSFLTDHNVSRQQYLTYLTIYSLSAPLMAVVAFVAISLLTSGQFQ